MNALLGLVLVGMGALTLHAGSEIAAAIYVASGFICCAIGMHSMERR